jgi:hypothetical protein
MKFKKNANWNIFSLLTAREGSETLFNKGGENIANYLKKFILFQFKNKFSNFFREFSLNIKYYSLLIKTAARNRFKTDCL